MGDAGIIQGTQQNMAATAAVQLFMRALQATNAELSEMVTQALNSNPALEELPPQHDAGESGPLNREGTFRHDRMLENQTEAPTLSHHLEEQIRQSALSPRSEAAALALLPYLNHHGFFTETPEHITQELGWTSEKFHRAQSVIQDLEPAGVGAADLRESLILQLQRKGEYRGLPMQLLQHYWHELVHHHYAEAARSLQVEEEAITLAARHIARLNPDPGSGFARAELNIITPDLIVTREGNELQVSLTNENIPQLTLSADYREMMAERADNPELRRYLSGCFREGRELIRALHNRQQTILLVAQAIVNRQKTFFLKGPEHLSALRMEDIAAALGVSTSTISRAVRGKFLKCDYGFYELRHFFSTAIEQGNGNTLSARAVQARIRAIISEENPTSPLSDTDIARQLADEGISIARRTIAKYREQLHILPASQRKK